MKAGSGKTHGEKNVHVERWQRQVEKYVVDDLVALYHRLPIAQGRFTARQVVIRRELEKRGLSLRDLGLDSPRGVSPGAQSNRVAHEMASVTDEAIRDAVKRGEQS